MKQHDKWAFRFRLARACALVLWLVLLVASCSGQPVTNGYITAVLRSPCADSPTPPPPVGQTVVGPGYVILTVADADPTDWANAQALVTDAVFESIMPLYCALPKNGCVTDTVQWDIITYQSNGSPLISGCAASGCEYRSCVGFESGPPVIVAEPADLTVNAGQTATFHVDASGAAPLRYQWFFEGTNALAGETNDTLVLPDAQTNQAGTYEVDVFNAQGVANSRFATLTVNPGPAAIHGYITAVLRSECADAPTPPPAIGRTAVGADYVILTVADADPTDWTNAQALASDTVFESIMPLYCALPKGGCISDIVQWNIITYDTNGNPLISGCAASGCQLRSCMGFESGPPVIVTEPTDLAVNAGQQAVFQVDASGAAPLRYQWFFDATNVLTGETNDTLVLSDAQTNQAGTYQVEISNTLGVTNSRAATLTVNPGPAAIHGYITAVLRSDCADAPTPPPGIGRTVVGSNYVILTVADADPTDWSNAQALVTDSAFESIMPLYCGLPKVGCVTDSVQWNIITYDTNGNPRISGCATSGCQAHSCAGIGNPPPPVTNGYITAVLRGDCADTPTPPPAVGQTVVGSNYVILTVADADPANWTDAQALVTDAVFQSIMPLYCALPKNGCVTDSAQWSIITYETNGSPLVSGCAASGCQNHACGVLEIPPPLPKLTISQTPTNLNLSWPALGSNYVLEESPDLINWRPYIAPPSTNGPTISAQPPAAGQGMFYRLRQQ